MPQPGRRTAYLPSLDGWRAVAIVSVILYHSTLHQAAFFSTVWATNYGYRGVDVFFAISGLLITSKLLEEEQSSGRISLKRFYLRRVFRILPAALVYLLTIAALSFKHWIYVSPGEWFASLFFYRNYSSLYHIDRTLQLPWFTTHFWSLSIEEHFYLVLPALLVLTRGKVRIGALGLISLGTMIHRQLELAHRNWLTIQFHTDIRLDALMIPALFAVVAGSSAYGQAFKSFVKTWHFVFVLGFVASFWLPDGSGMQATTIAFTLPGILLGTVLKAENFATRLLEWSPLRFIGRISYSLYLWQQLFFTQRFLEFRPLGRLQAWPLNLLMTLTIAICSYTWVERPMVRLGHRLTSGRSGERPQEP